MSKRFFRLYRAAYRGTGWIVEHAGPFAHALTNLATRIHGLVPRSVYAHNPVQIDGLYIYHEGLPVAARSLGTGMYEADTTRLLKSLVRPGMTVLDVGANIGYFSLLLARFTGINGSVWAFEPVSQNLQLLHKNVEVNGYEERIHIVPQAVSNDNGATHLYVNITTMGLSSLYKAAAAYEQTESSFEHNHDGIVVVCTTLDTWAAQHQWPRIDLVKVDVEGAETSVLAGMVELSSRNPGLQLIIEFNIRTLHAAGTTEEEFYAALRACGFNHIAVIGDKLRPLDLPADIPWLLRALHRRGSESVNLLCTKQNGSSNKRDTL